jgi:hypothetical protein
MNVSTNTTFGLGNHGVYSMPEWFYVVNIDQLLGRLERGP